MKGYRKATCSGRLLLTFIILMCCSLAPVYAQEGMQDQNALIQQNLSRFINQKVASIDINSIARNFNISLSGGSSCAQILNLAKEYYSKGDSRTSQALFKEALSQVNISGDRAKLADSLIEIGSFFNQKGDRSNALDYLTRAVDASILANDDNRLQSILPELEKLYIWQETGTAASSDSSRKGSSGSARREGTSVQLGDRSISIPSIKLPDILNNVISVKGNGNTGIDLSSILSAPGTSSESVIAIPKIEFPGSIMTVAIPRTTGNHSGKKSPVISIPRTVPLSKPDRSKETTRQGAAKTTGQNGASTRVISAISGEVLPCAGPKANLKAYDNLDVQPQWATRYLKPVPGGRYAPYAGDTGVDIVAPRTIPFYASKAGVVVYSAASGHCRQRGPGDDQGAMRIRHADGTETFYAHLSGRNARLKGGSRVSQGDWMGNIGTANRVPHLHFTIYYSHWNYESAFTTPKKLLDPWPMLTYNI